MVGVLMDKRLIGVLLAMSLLTACGGQSLDESYIEELPADTSYSQKSQVSDLDELERSDLKGLKVEDILTPVTHITGNVDSSEKATVMESSLSVEDTALVYINEEEPESYTDLLNDEAITLYYDDAVVLVYKGEEEKTYVQKSSRKYVHRHGFSSIYRPYRTNIFWYSNRQYERKYYKRDNERYGSGGYEIKATDPKPASKVDKNKISTGQNDSSKVKTNSDWNNLKTNGSSGNSVKTGSTGTRTSIGGGTSFGK